VAQDKEFIAKNGLIANGNMIVAKGGTGKVGIHTDTPDANVSIVGTANVSGDVALGSTTTMQVANVVTNLQVGGNTTVTGIVNVASDIKTATQMLVGSNVAINTSVISVGNSTVNTTSNSTVIKVGGGSTVNSTAFLTGSSVVNATAIGQGNTILTNSGISSNGTISIVGAATFANTLTVTGTANAASFNAGANVSLSATGLFCR
jgi:hypothetical protein